jgi:hypothetical protein
MVDGGLGPAWLMIYSCGRLVFVRQRLVDRGVRRGVIRVLDSASHTGRARDALGSRGTTVGRLRRLRGWLRCLRLGNGCGQRQQQAGKQTAAWVLVRHETLASEFGQHESMPTREWRIPETATV